MIADTTNATPFFLEEKPDWSLTYEFEQDWTGTGRTTSANGTEQRTRKRLRPRYKLTYMLAALTVAEYSVRKARSMRDTARPVVLPIWHAWQAITAMTTVDIAAVAVDLTSKQYKVGGYAYFEQPGKTSVFRLITALTTNSITFAATPAAFPVIAVPAFTAGARVYPCITGMRSDDSAQFDSGRVDDTTETIAIEEL